LPSLQRSVLTEFVTSGLFHPSEFIELRLAALNLQMQIDFLETVLVTVRDQLAQATPEGGAALRARIPDAPQIEAVKDAMDELAAALDATGEFKDRSFSIEQFVSSDWEITKNQDGSVNWQLTPHEKDGGTTAPP
jgi:hypothetical protein